MDFEILYKKNFNPDEEYLGKTKEVNEIQPLVSICTATYQHASYIGDCIESILNQKTNFPMELIIGEDQSTDGTREICKKYAEEHQEKIRLFLRDRNTSCVFNENGKRIFGFNGKWTRKSARGKYIALCEGDDYWTDPLKLQKQVNFMENNSEVIMTYHDFINSLDDEMHLEDYYEPVNVPLLRPRTLTLMFRNVLNDYPADLMKAANGDQALRFYLSTKGEIKALQEIKPSVRRIHSGGIMSLKSKKTRLERGLKTWQIICNTYSDTKHSKKLEKKVKGFESSLKWLAFKNDRDIRSFKTAILHDMRNGLLLRKIKNNTKSFIIKAFLQVKNITNRKDRINN